MPDSLRRTRKSKRSELQRLQDTKVRDVGLKEFTSQVLLAKGVKMLAWENLGRSRKQSVKDKLDFDDTAAIICRDGISDAFISSIVEDDDMNGIILIEAEGEKRIFGFMFYESRGRGEEHIKLLCVSRPAGKFLGVPFAKILIKRLERNKDVKKITLEAVADALKFYYSVGFTLDKPERFNRGNTDMTKKIK